MPYVTAWRRTTLLLSKNKGGHTEPALIGARRMSSFSFSLFSCSYVSPLSLSIVVAKTTWHKAISALSINDCYATR